MTTFARPIFPCGAAVAALLAVVLVAGGETLAQDTSQPPAAALAPSATPAVPPQPPPAERPGFLHQLRVWWDDSVAVIDRTIKGPQSKPADSSTKASGNSKASAEAGNTTATGAAQDIANGAAAVTQDAVKSAVEATKGAATTATDAMKGAMEVTKNAASAIVRLPGTRVVDIHETCAKAPNGAPDCSAAAATGCRAKGFSGGNPLDVRTAQKCDAAPGQSSNVAGAVACSSEAVVIRAVCQ